MVKIPEFPIQTQVLYAHDHCINVISQRKKRLLKFKSHLI